MSPTPHTLILASAGSGKTHALTTRLLSLVARGADPGRILATTFTRKAAGEILSRALERACAAAEDPADRATLSRDIQTNLDEARSRALALSLLRSMHRLRVLTIDSFLLSAVSAVAWEAGLPGAPAPMDEATRGRRTAQGADAALDEPERAEMLELFTAHAEGGAARGAHSTLMGVIGAGLDAYLDSAGREAPWIAWRPPPGAETLDAATLSALAAEIEATPTPLKRDGEPYKQFPAGVRALAAAIRAEDWTAVLASTLAANARTTRTYANAPIPDSLARAASRAADHAGATRLRRLALRTRATHGLLSRFHAAYERVKRDAGACEFADLPRLLAHVQDRLQDVYYRLDGAVHHLLLDEFQDTSRAQFAALRPMLEEALSQADPERTVFCVGDAKQCLYEWREATPELLLSLPAQFPGAFKIEPLSENYRSSPDVLEAVNRVFGTLPSNPALRERADAARAWAASFERHEAKRQDRAGFVALRLAPAPPSETGRAPVEERRGLAFAHAVDRVAAIVAAAPGATVGVLVRRRRHVATLVGLLLDRDIGASREGGNPLTDAPIVAAAASMLHFADHPGDTGSLMHALATPIGGALGLPDPRRASGRENRQAASALRRRFAQEGYAGALDALGRAIAPKLDANSFARWQQALDAADAFDAGDARRATDLARTFRERSVEAPSPARVRVMTIHASKGLEFDAVVLPDLDDPWDMRPGALLVDRDDPLGPPERIVWNPPRAIRALDPALDAMHERAVMGKTREELSTLYVAMTRARRCLEMIVAPSTRRQEETDATAPSGARVILAALPDAVGASTPGDVAWSIGDERAWARRLAGEPGAIGPPRAAPATISLRFAKPPRALDPSLLARAPVRHPSEAEPRVARPAEALASPPRSALGVGEAVHAWLARIEWIESAPLPADEALLADALAGGVSERDAREALTRFRRALELPEVRSALSRDDAAARAGAHASIEALRERPFALRDPRPSADGILVGRFDRLVVARDEGGQARWAEVIDFKTDSLRAPEADFLRAQAERRRPQMEAYRLAAARLLRLDPDRVGARLVFTSLGRVVDAR